MEIGYILVHLKYVITIRNGENEINIKSQGSVLFRPVKIHRVVVDPSICWWPSSFALPCCTFA